MIKKPHNKEKITYNSRFAKASKINFRLEPGLMMLYALLLFLSLAIGSYIYDHVILNNFDTNNTIVLNAIDYLEYNSGQLPMAFCALFVSLISIWAFKPTEQRVKPKGRFGHRLKNLGIIKGAFLLSVLLLFLDRYLNHRSLMLYFYVLILPLASIGGAVYLYQRMANKLYGGSIKGCSMIFFITMSITLSYCSANINIMKAKDDINMQVKDTIVHLRNKSVLTIARSQMLSANGRYFFIAMDAQFLKALPRDEIGYIEFINNK